MHCTQCGNSITETTKFCGSCGQKAPVGQAKASPGSETGAAVEPQRTEQSQAFKRSRTGAKFTKCEASRPDSDGEINFDLEAIAINTTGDTVRLIQSTCMAINSDGHVVACGGQNEEFVRLEPSDSQPVSCGWFRISKNVLGNDPTKAKFQLFVSMFTREFAQITPTRVPQPNEGLKSLAVTKKFDGLQADLSINTWSTNESDGQVTISWGLMVLNNSSKALPKITLKTELLDEENAVLEQTDSSTTLQPGGVEWMESSFSGVRRGQAKQAQLRFSIASYSLLECLMTESTKTNLSND